MICQQWKKFSYSPEPIAKANNWYARRGEIFSNICRTISIAFNKHDKRDLKLKADRQWCTVTVQTFLTNKIQNLSQIFSPFIFCFLQILKHAKVSTEICNQWRFKRSDPPIQKLFHPPQTHLKQQTAVPCHLMRKNDQNWFALKCKENTRIKHTSPASCY